MPRPPHQPTLNITRGPVVHPEQRNYHDLPPSGRDYLLPSLSPIHHIQASPSRPEFLRIATVALSISLFELSPNHPEASMPTTATKQRFEMPRLENDNLSAIPSWAHPKFRQSEQLFSQLTEQIVKMEKTIADLQNRKEKEDWPRSIQVNVEIKVKDAQQPQVDTIVLNAKKIFCNTVLLGLIQARQLELAQLRSDLAKVTEDFFKYIRDNLGDLQENGIPLSQEDAEVDETIDVVKVIVEDHTTNIDRAFRTFHFLKTKEELNAKQAREAEKEQRRVDMELEDPILNRIQKRLEKVENSLKKQPKNPSPKKGQAPPKKARPFQKRPQKQKEGKQKKQPKGEKGNHGRAQGNPKPRPRYTNTTNRSGSRPPNSRQKQN